MAASFPPSVDIQVRGYELDQWGHVNNAVYLNYLEHARWQLGGHLPMLGAAEGILPVVRHVTLDYRCEARMHDQLKVTLWPRRVGNTSFTLGAAIRIVATGDHSEARRGRHALVATTVLTCFRRPEGKLRVPDAWRSYFPATDPGEEPPAHA